MDFTGYERKNEWSCSELRHATRTQWWIKVTDPDLFLSLYSTFMYEREVQFVFVYQSGKKKLDPSVLNSNEPREKYLGPVYFFEYQQFSWMLSNRLSDFQIVEMNQEALYRRRQNKILLGMDSNLVPILCLHASFSGNISKTNFR